MVLFGPSPILRTSSSLTEGPENRDPPEGHQMLVDKVLLALQPSVQVSSDSDHEMSDSGKVDGDSVDAEDPMEQEDSMTLV